MCNVNDEAISKPKMDYAIKDMKRGKQMCMYILYILSYARYHNINVY